MPTAICEMAGQRTLASTIGDGGAGHLDEREAELHADGGDADVGRRGQKTDDAAARFVDAARDRNAVDAQRGGGLVVEADAERIQGNVVGHG